MIVENHILMNLILILITQLFDLLQVDFEDEEDERVIIQIGLRVFRQIIHQKRH